MLPNFHLFLIIFLSISFENGVKKQTVNGFLLTHKFQIYLNHLRNTNNNEFVYKWDYLNQNNNNAGFTYTTNQFGKFVLLVKYVLFIEGQFN